MLIKGKSLYAEFAMDQYNFQRDISSHRTRNVLQIFPHSTSKIQIRRISGDLRYQGARHPIHLPTICPPPHTPTRQWVLGAHPSQEEEFRAVRGLEGWGTWGRRGLREMPIQASG